MIEQISTFSVYEDFLMLNYSVSSIFKHQIFTPIPCNTLSQKILQWNLLDHPLLFETNLPNVLVLKNLVRFSSVKIPSQTGILLLKYPI